VTMTNPISLGHPVLSRRNVVIDEVAASLTAAAFGAAPATPAYARDSNEGAHAPIGSPATAAFEARCCPTYRIGVVADEPEWRALPKGSAMAVSAPTAIATRWHAVTERTREFGAETADDCHIVKIVLRSMNIRLSVAGRTVLDGLATPGMFHVTEPAVPVRCLFRGPYDVLHLHVPNSLIGERARALPGRQMASLCSEANPAKDPMVERLGPALLGADQVGGSLGQLYADCIAIVMRLLALACQALPFERPKVPELVRWRLKRAIDYVEAHLAEPVRLADVASATGLTRMHFAAQFRAATGLRPHEYLLRRRVEHAQEMLVETDMSMAEVALSVGFQTQSRFTSVFTRFSGQPPGAWRRPHGGEPIPTRTTGNTVGRRVIVGERSGQLISRTPLGGRK
jgi:AraC family transcriptional regulator